MLITVVARTQNHRSANITNHVAGGGSRVVESGGGEQQTTIDREPLTLCGLGPGLDEYTRTVEVEPFEAVDDEAVLARFPREWQPHCRRCLALLRRKITAAHTARARGAECP